MEQQQQNSRTPTDFLNGVIGRQVLVKLNSGIDYKGTHSTDTCSGTLLPKSLNVTFCCRSPGVFGWLHEHRAGKYRGVREWAAKE